MLSKKDFDLLPSNAIFAQGETFDNEEGINLLGTGKPLRWVAKKGSINDWAIYAHFSMYSYAYIEACGDKVQQEENILHVVPCEKEVLKLYRH